MTNEQCEIIDELVKEEEARGTSTKGLIYYHSYLNFLAVAKPAEIVRYFYDENSVGDLLETMKLLKQVKNPFVYGICKGHPKVILGEVEVEKK